MTKSLATGAATEAEWLCCRFQRPMLHFLEGKASQRKLRLFAAACCRRVWSKLSDERSRRAVEVAERFADSLAKKRELHRAGEDAVAAFRDNCRAQTGDKDLFYPMSRAPAAFRRNAPAAVRWACLAAWTSADDAGDAAKTAESVANVKDLLAHCDLMREVIGNPFRPVALAPPNRKATVVALAQTAYEERILPVGILDPVRLAILADRLEEAGCTDTAILGHLRGPGPHARGCWALDLVLDKC